MNRKGQFFIFAAVLVLFSLLVIQYSLLSYRQVSQSVTQVPFSDVPFIASYIESSVRDTSKNAFEEIYRSGDLTSIHESFSGIYSAHYEIEEKELNYYLSRLDVGIDVIKTSNIGFDHDTLFIGPSIFEVGNFNRKLLVGTVKISDAPKIYLMQSDIGQFRVAPLVEAAPISISNPYVMKIDLNNNGIYEQNEILYRESNYSSESRIIYNNRAYTIGELRTSYAGIDNIENKAPFLELYSLNIGNDGKNYIGIRDSNGNIVSLDGLSRFYEGDIFLLDTYLVKVVQIQYSANGQKDDFVKYIIVNMQISLQETERRREWFDPNDSPGLRYGLVEVQVLKENALKTSQIYTGDKVIFSSSIHNDLESPISDKDINGSKNLGSSIKIWEIVNVVLSGEEGTFYSENSNYKVQIDSDTGKITGVYEWTGSTWQLINIQRCSRDNIGNLICASAYPIEEGFQFFLKGEEYIVKDITDTSVNFLRRNMDKLDVTVDKGSNPLSPDYGEFKLAGVTYRAYVVKVSGNVNAFRIIVDPPTGNDIPLKIGDPLVLGDYGLIFESTNFLDTDENWHIFFKYFDMRPDKTMFPVGKTRLFYGWKNGDFDVINQWTYSYNPLSNKLKINSIDPIYNVETNSTLITSDGILVFIPSFNNTNFYEYDMYYPKHNQQIYLGETLTLFEINTFNQYIRIKIDENRNGIIDAGEGYITINGRDRLEPGDIFYSGGIGFEVVSIVPFHDDGDSTTNPPDEVSRVLLKRVPYYQYTPILERTGKNNIEEFTTILSVYDYYVRRPGDYLVVFTYSFEIDGIKKETSQYYNFKVYQ